MILDCSYSYHANNMYDQQVAPMEIYVTNKHQQTNTPKQQPYLQSSNNHVHICFCF